MCILPTLTSNQIGAFNKTTLAGNIKDTFFVGVIQADIGKQVDRYTWKTVIWFFYINNNKKKRYSVH